MLAVAAVVTSAVSRTRQRRRRPPSVLAGHTEAWPAIQKPGRPFRSLSKRDQQPRQVIGEQGRRCAVKDVLVVFVDGRRRLCSRCVVVVFFKSASE